MKIWLTRHGQTNLNKKHLMQGKTDEPLNETGRKQAAEARQKIGNIHFDAVYSSRLDRAIETASIIGNVPRDQVIIDDRLIEVEFGKYEMKKYYGLGLKMTAFWLLPEILPAPKTVESVQSMVRRSSSFLNELETKDYDNVLIVCHGGIIRALRGYLEDRKNGIRWRPKPKNCEIIEYEFRDGKHRTIHTFK
ncbi:histidine phosphatase family protein [Catenisphaera adipataccumulans]|uniref:Alpha-ribazole phosphatase/probable phosphoglycerate mutase n=1 Tax=Catenisphaera adipataccumulans TaxID=700500 RepID=A0A7W8CZD9_9FIRM|nr:histidine phosphatase family protein [Catenisphaera adipataccumulans]MBB5182765.1 alpha-ribazole phosphatase/probable phosphoglycerate mutase [Catenisphaera adipataccumulans]